MLSQDLVKRGDFRSVGTPIVNISINGQKVKDWETFHVELNGLGAVDSYEVMLPWDVTDKPRDPLLYSGPNSSADLVLGSATLKIEAGFEGEGDPGLLIEGNMDYPAWDFDSGENVTIHGRSYAAKPFDEKESVKWQNLTSTAAFRQICEYHGLTPVVPVETNTLIGEYSGDDHVNLNREVSHWDFVLYLCSNEGFTTRVKGTEWFFGPHESLPGYLLDPLPFTWGYNIDRPFRIERAPNAARNLIIEVISWVPGKGKQKGQRIVEKASFVGSSTGNKYTLRYYFPNITRDEAQRRARNLLAENSRLQLYGSFNTDWYPELSNDRRIALYGVGMGLSQVYFAPKIVITGSKEDGIKAEITFTNLPLEEGGNFG